MILFSPYGIVVHGEAETTTPNAVNVFILLWKATPNPPNHLYILVISIATSLGFLLFVE